MGARVYPVGLDRPVVGIVSVDPAYTGDTGLAVGRFDGQPLSWQGDILTTGATRWLGDAACSVCKPGERLVLVAESTAYGGMGVARKLGIAVGAVEGCLIDLNVIEPRTRVDIPVNVWRRVLGIQVSRDGTKASRRYALKLQALDYAREFEPRILASEYDRAEALCVWLVAKGKLS